MGSTMGFTTILVGKLQQEDDEALRMSLEDASWIGKLNYSEAPEYSSFSGTAWALASTISSLFGGLLADSIGRKRAIIVSSVPFIASWVLLTTATSTSSVLISMVLSGLGDGLMFPIIPIYVTEIATPRLRGITLTTIIGHVRFCKSEKYVSFASLGSNLRAKYEQNYWQGASLKDKTFYSP